MKERLRIAINAQIVPDGPWGGIVTVLRSLTALAELENRDEEIVFVGPYEDPEWLRPYLSPTQKIVRGPEFMSVASWRRDAWEPFKHWLGPIRPLAREVKRSLVRAKAVATKPPLSPATSHAFFSGLGCDVIHFPFQSFEDCGIPAVYNPHDLQHLHFGGFFPPSEISRRESLYRFACRTAKTVVVASQFVKEDVVSRYAIDPHKVQVVPWAPPPLEKKLADFDEDAVRRVRAKYALANGPFALYPAMTWEHKNHIRLLEAMARFRARDASDLRLVCTGSKTEFWPSIERRLNQLGLNEVVKFPGLVPLDDLSALYRAADFVVIPTLFEAASAPVFEAWQHNTAVACSSVTSLPEQVADAALLFDPYSVKEIASVLELLTNVRMLRDDLKRRGSRRLKDFNLERMAKTYRAIYRRTADRRLSEEDHELLTHTGTEVRRRGARV